MPIASSMKNGKTNVNDWQKPKLQGKATLDLMGCALEKFSQETTETFNASKLKKHKKPHQQEGNMLQKWKDKCYLRRQQRKHAGEWKEKQNASLQPWIKVDRKKIKTNSMLRFATWNVRTLRTLTSLSLVAEDLKKHKILIAGLQECRWLEETNGRKEGEYKFWGGGAWKNDAQATQGGIAIAVHKSLWGTVERFILVSGRTAVMTLKAQMGKRIVFCTAWCPVEEDTEAEKEIFWTDFRKMANHPELQTSAADTLIVTGDFNGELPPYSEEEDKTVQSVVGRWSTNSNESYSNGLRLNEEAALLKLCATSSQVRSSARKTWTFLFRTAINRKRREYDQTLVPYKDKGFVKKSTVVRDTLHESDHALVITDMRLPHIKDKKTVSRSQITNKLRLVRVADHVGNKLRLSNKFTGLDLMENDEVQKTWTEFQKIIVEAAEEVKTEEIKPRRPWISERTMDLIRKRATTKKDLLENEEKAKHHNFSIELRDLRQAIRKSARKDRKNWTKAIIEDIEKSGNSGDSKKVYANVKKLAGKQGTPPANLDGTDSDIWVSFFSNLLGKESKPEEATGENLKEKLAWRICKQNLKPEKKSEQWDMDLSIPEQEEIINILKKAAKGKSVSGIIPTEFWQKCPIGQKILTSFIQKIWKGATPPEEWLNAALCLLYKDKGSIKDPNSYRGISLLSSAEKIISLIILERIKPHLDLLMNKRQSGFSTGKSCRNAVFILLREIEKCIQDNKPLIFNFVDFRKAFDSLDWETMWKVMEAQGMPVQIINVIKELYNNATVSVRLNPEGKLAPSFNQKVGIRQGCSLSPAIFILILDYALKAYMEACKELNIDAEAGWFGYADDLAVKSSEVAPAEAAFHQLQAACAFVGLHCNIDKTECMALNVVKPSIPKHEARKERIQVTYADGKFEGWLIDWSGRAKMLDEKELIEMDTARLTPEPTHLIIFDKDEQGKSDKVAIQMGKNGWLTDQDGDKHRCKLLGSKEYIEDKKNITRCDKCNIVFSSKRALNSHDPSKCRKRDEMTTEEQAKLRRKRESNANIAGRKYVGVEQIRMKDVNGNMLDAVAMFKYLGTLLSTDGWSTKEINRRLGIAAATMASLNKLWASAGIPLSLKCQLYKALVMTVVLYNGECWLMKKQDLERLEGFHFRCLRRLTRKKRQRDLGDMDIDKASKKDVFNAAKVPGIEELLREKRLRWFGHLMREKEGDPAKEAMREEKRRDSKWYQQLRADLATRKLSVEKAEIVAQNRVRWRSVSSARCVHFPYRTGKKTVVRLPSAQ